jgi:hypothetical protein
MKRRLGRRSGEHGRETKPNETQSTLKHDRERTKTAQKIPKSLQKSPGFLSNLG